MKTLIVSDSKCDFVDVLESCGAETECIEFQKVLTVKFGGLRFVLYFAGRKRRLSGSKIPGKAGERSGEKGEKKFFCRQFGDFRIFYVENQQTVLKAG